MGVRGGKREKQSVVENTGIKECVTVRVREREAERKRERKKNVQNVCAC